MMSRLVLACLLLATPACSQCATTPPAPADAAQATAQALATIDAARAPGDGPAKVTYLTAFTVDAIDGLPPELVEVRPLWESGLDPSLHPSSGVTRVYPDGRVFLYSAFRRTVVDGRQTAVDAPRAWRFEGRLSKQGLVELRREIGVRIDQGVLPLPGAPFTVEVYPLQSTTTQYRAWVDDREYVTVLVNGTYDLPTPLTPILAAIDNGTIRGSVPTEQP